jgi:hypothetical protein
MCFAVVELLKIKSAVSFGIATTLGASFLAAWRFVKDYSREPTLEEKKSYASQALISVWVISLLLAVIVFAVFLSPSEAGGMLNLMTTRFFLLAGLGMAVVTSLVYYVAIRWSFGWYVKLACKQLPS